MKKIAEIFLKHEPQSGILVLTLFFAFIGMLPVLVVGIPIKLLAYFFAVNSKILTWTRLLKAILLAGLLVPSVVWAEFLIEEKPVQ